MFLAIEFVSFRVLGLLCLSLVLRLVVSLSLSISSICSTSSSTPCSWSRRAGWIWKKLLQSSRRQRQTEKYLRKRLVRLEEPKPERNTYRVVHISQILPLRLLNHGGGYLAT